MLLILTPQRLMFLFLCHLLIPSKQHKCVRSFQVLQGSEKKSEPQMSQMSNEKQPGCFYIYTPLKINMD